MHRLRRRLCVAILLCVAATARAGVYEEMLDAVNNDDERSVAELLKRGMDVNTVGPNGDSVLMVAARHGKPGMVKTVLDARPRINVRNAFGETALMLAVFQGHTEVVRQLLTRGAEVNHSGWTPLMYAAARDRVEIARILISQGAQPNAQAENGTTALMMAAREGHLKMVLVLLEHGAELNQKTPAGYTALGMARGNGRRDVVEMLTRAGAVE